MPETPDALDQRGVSVRAGVVVRDAAWRQDYDRALAGLEMPGIVVVLGPAGVGGTFLQELMAGLRERGRAVTFVPRADLVRLWSVGNALVIEDAARMDAELLETICRPPGRRVVLAGLPASALAELPAPLTVVTLEPLAPGTAAAPGSSMSIARAVVPWRQPHDRALAALEMPGIVVVLGPAGTGRTFLQELMAGLRERGCAVTFLARADLVRCWPAGSALVIEDAAQMDSEMLGAICRPPGRRVVFAGLPAFALFELPAPLTVVSLEPLAPGTAAAPVSSSISKARAAAIGLLAVNCVAVALLWTRAPLAPPALAPSRGNALQPAVELPAAPGSPEPAPPAPAIATPPPAASASEQPGDATSAISPAPMPAGGEDRPGIVTSREIAVPAVAQTGPRSGGEPAPPPLQVGPSPVPDSRQALNVAPAAAIAPLPLAEAPRAPEPATPSGSAPQLLPENAPVRVLVSYGPRSAAARQEAARVVRLLRGGGLAARAAPAARVAGKTGITYFFAEDRDGARRVERDLGEAFGASRLSPAARGERLRRPGTIEVLVPARRPP